MSLNVYMLSVDALKARTAIHGNIDPKLLLPEIKLAQDMFIHPILGTALYDKIIGDINASGAPTGDYLTLLTDYIIDPLMYYVLAGLPEAISYQFYNKGVIRKVGDNTELPSMSELIDVANKYRIRADWYAERLVKYLKQNATANKFPEYLNPGDGIDTVIPDNEGFNMPIYLGDSENDYIKNAFPGLRNYNI